MPKGLTGKQEQYARNRAVGMMPSDAYKNSYESKNFKSSRAIHANAQRLERDPKVKTRILELCAEVEELNLWSRVDSLEALINIVRDDKAKNGDKINAVKTINAMHGWDKKTISFLDGEKASEQAKPFSEMYGKIEADEE